MGVWNPGPAATTGDDIFTGDGTGETANGLEGDDTLNGNGGSDTLHDSAGRDTLNGGDGNDILIATVAGFALSEAYNGGADFDTIRLTGPIDPGFGFNFNSFTITGIEAIEFAADAPGTSLTLYNTLIGAGLASNVLFTGNSSSIDQLYFQSFTSGVYSLATIQFANWSANDFVQMAGWHDSDVLIGSIQNDVIYGIGGNDSVAGGSGNDTIDGGGGIDLSSYSSVASSASSWHRNPDGTWTVTAGAHGTDTVNDVEFLDFSDRDVHLDYTEQSFTGDGTSDLILRNSAGTLSLWFINGPAITGGGIGSIGAEWTPFTGTLDQDDNSEILWRNTVTGDMSLWYMSGPVVVFATSMGNVATNWIIEGLGDFDGDTRDDILWRNSTTGDMSIWFMGGSTVQSSSAFGNVSAGWVVEGLADFNGDGRDDILWRNSSSGAMSMWFMNGPAVTGGAFGNVGATWVVEGTGEFNGDGRDDIFWRNSATGGVSLWFMNGQAVTGTAGFGIATTWTAEAVGDYNGNGTDDIIWRDGAGNLAAWYVNGASVTGGSLGTLSTDWVINPGG